MTTPLFGFTPEEIDTASPTRTARLKWVVVVNDALPAGRAVNAAVCVAAATGPAVAGLLGPHAVDADGTFHPGLPWAGCTILGASSERLAAIRAKAASSEGVLVCDMPSDAQLTRVYDEYLENVARKNADELEYYAVGIVGPRNRVDRIIGGLPLLP
ncbi:DUF2000 domain-containing protein [Glaciihabitans sp. dw_435]|uniref:DUF2000 domain-containing protein n=1 Tax=Glaciihabitans sp. dw_435 TaxID=2720081 RepID=UPI001BD6481B|nr:DUF2000 domain-containing protein [Glaciihabitans sp. dw_435]